MRWPSSYTAAAACVSNYAVPACRQASPSQDSQPFRSVGVATVTSSTCSLAFIGTSTYCHSGRGTLAVPSCPPPSIQSAPGTKSSKDTQCFRPVGTWRCVRRNKGDSICRWLSSRRSAGITTQAGCLDGPLAGSLIAKFGYSSAAQIRRPVKSLRFRAGLSTLRLCGLSALVARHRQSCVISMPTKYRHSFLRPAYTEADVELPVDRTPVPTTLSSVGPARKSSRVRNTKNSEHISGANHTAWSVVDTNHLPIS